MTKDPMSARFIELMQFRGWNQSQTARQLHVTSNHVNMICKGRGSPSAPLLALLEVKTRARAPMTLLQDLEQLATRLEQEAKQLRAIIRQHQHHP